MAVSGVLFVLWRIAQFITLIPIIGMLAWFVSGYVDANQLTPDPVLVLFIVASLAGFWVLLTLLGYAAARRSAAFVALVDLIFVGAFIAGVYSLRGVTGWDCGDPTENDGIFRELGVFGLPGVRSGSDYADNPGKNCAMLKASFALAIMNTIFFFFTFLLALLVHRHHKKDERKHSSSSRRKHGSRHRRGSRSSYEQRQHHHSHYGGGGGSGGRTHRSSRRDYHV